MDRLTAKRVLRPRAARIPDFFAQMSDRRRRQQAGAGDDQGEAARNGRRSNIVIGKIITQAGAERSPRVRCPFLLLKKRSYTTGDSSSQIPCARRVASQLAHSPASSSRQLSQRTGKQKRRNHALSHLSTIVQLFEPLENLQSGVHPAVDNPD